MSDIKRIAHTNKKTAKATNAARDFKRGRALKRARGDGEIYDVIDEWLAKSFAHWIANQIEEVPLQVIGQPSTAKSKRKK